MPRLPNWMTRLWPVSPAAPRAALAGAEGLLDLPLYPEVEIEPAGVIAGREAATLAVAERRDTVRRQAQEDIMLPFGAGSDADDVSFRRLTSGAKVSTRDLSLLQQDRMLEVVWFLWEQNPLAKRLITLMTHLILGEGIKVQAKDERIQAEIDATWNHPLNVIPSRILEFHNALSLNGELILPVTTNEVTGRPVFGFFDPTQVKAVHPLPGNVLIPDILELKPTGGGGEGQKLKIVRVNPETNRLEGDVFYFGINKLPNSTRGRSDLLPLADWLDLYDQYMFAEVERLNLLSMFIYDYKIDGADDKIVRDKVAKLKGLKPGTVFGHNEKESLAAVTPNLQATDRSEVARSLRVHIAGGIGYPSQWLGDGDSSNRSTIEGQNDVAMKTPAARQKEIAGIIGMLVRFTIEHTTTKNRALFQGAKTDWAVVMPEIQAKDVARVGTVIQNVASAMDTSISNRTMSKRAAATVQISVMKHLGVDLDVEEVLAEAEQEAQDAAEKDDAMAMAMAKAAQLGNVGQQPNGGLPTKRTNPPIRGAA